MKILLLADGRSVHTCRYQRGLSECGVEVVLASLENGDTVDIRLKRMSISNSLNYLLANREIKRLVKKIKPDIVNPHFASAYGFSTALSQVWRRIPVALHCLGSDILISPFRSMAHRRKVVYALSKARIIFADSNYLAECIRALYPVENINVIPWGVEPELVALFENKKRPALNSGGSLKILIPRPHSKVYNNEFILRSLSNMTFSQRLILFFPDRGKRKDAFQRLAASLCPDIQIEYYKFLPRSEYIKFLAGFDFFLSAALSDSSPASLLEAMGAGLFPIVGDIPGVREWVDNNNCLLFNPSDPESLRDAFARIPQDTEKFESILRANHEKVKKEALFTHNMKETVRILESALHYDL
jgi:glycosyltransferase involved in cell wall biosynthesis